MRPRTLKNRLLSFLLLLPLGLLAQNPSDCNGAIVVCEDTDVSVPDSGGDVADFNDPDNGLGCQLTGESSAVWLYFSFRDDMPPGSELRFSITPFELYGDGEEPDYDFSLFAPGQACENLGDPIRCSYAWAISNNTFDCGFCPSTGLGNGETDLGEGPFGNGYVAPVVVEPGQGFYLYVNEFPNNADANSISEGFNISFSGSAAPYLDCGVNPECDQQVVSLGEDTTLCSGDVPYLLEAEVTYATGYEQYTWRGFNGEETFLDDPNSPSPALTFPDGYAGTVTYELEVASGDCINYDTISLSVEPTPTVMVEREATFCEGDSILLDAGPGFATYLWSDGSTTSSITVNEGGTYGLTLTPPNGVCTISRAIEVEALPSPQPQISGDTFLCAGAVDTLYGPAGQDNYLWTGGSTDSFLLVDQAGGYALQITSPEGCVGTAAFPVQDAPLQDLEIQGPAGLCPDAADTLTASGSWAEYEWSGGSTDTLLPVDNAGTYQLAATDTFGCVYEDSLLVEAYDAPVPVVAGDTSFCEEASVTVGLSATYASYDWAGLSSTPTLTVDTPGNYSLTVTNANGCRGDTTFTIAELPKPDLDLPASTSYCAGGSIALQAPGVYTSYAWSNGSGADSISVSSPGNYSLTVTNAFGCTAADTIEVQEEPLPASGLSGPYRFCTGASVTLSAQPGQSSYEWPDGSTSPTLTVDSAGWYRLTITGNNGCSAIDSAEVLESPLPQPSIIGNDKLCTDSTLLLQGDPGYEDYQWSNGLDSQQISLDTPGVYELTVTDQNGCQGSTALIVEEVPIPQMDLPDQLEFCEGNTVALDAGAGYAAYLWSNSATSQSIQVNQAGAYALTVTDANGCTNSGVVNAIENSPIPIQLEGPQSFCYQESTTLSITGEDAFSAITWPDGSTGSSATFDSPGSYAVAVVDTNDCSNELFFSITELPAIEFNLQGPAAICDGDTALISIDTSFLSYSWSNGSDSAAILAQQAGTYTLTVTDASGCQGVGAFDLTVNEYPVLNLPDTVSFCASESATLEASSPDTVSFSWSNGATGSQIELSQEGRYSLAATNAFGCTSRDTAFAQALPEPSPQLFGDSSLCPGDSSVLSILEPYPSLLWSSGDTTASLTVGQAGNYEVTVTDEAGCSGSASLAVADVEGTDIDLPPIAAFCEGDTVRLSANSANASSFAWSTGDSGGELSISQSGTYAVTATNDFGCQATDSLEVNAFERPSANAPPYLSDCAGTTLTFSAAAGFEDYQWNTGAHSEGISASQSGLYIVTVTDSNGCRSTDTTEVFLQPPPNPGLSNAQNICLGNTTQLEVSGQWASIEWTTGATTPSIEVSEEGAYGVIVRDSLGCVGQAVTVVKVFEVPAPDIEAPIGICPGETTTLSAAPGFEQYNWNNGATTQQINVQEPGMYSVTVTDSVGCFNENSWSLKSYELPEAQIRGDSFLCTGETNLLSVETEADDILWSTGATTPDISTSTPGWYSVRVINQFNCRAADSLLLEDTAPPEAMPGNPPQLDCDHPVVALGPASGGDAQLAYQWEGPGISTANSQLPAPEVDLPGNYSLTVIDTLTGCVSATAELVLEDLSFTPTATLAPPDTLDCNTPSVSLDGSGSQSGPTFAYQWLNPDGDTIAGADGLVYQATQTGLYTLSVLDTSTGCRNTASVSVAGDFAVPTAVLNPNVGQLDCRDSVVEISGSAHVPAGQPELAWAQGSPQALIPGASNSSYTTNDPGWYFFIVTDPANGCQAMDSVLVEQDVQAPAAVLNAEGQINCLETNASLSGQGSSVGSDYQYDWSGPGGFEGGNALVHTVGQPGTYSLTVTDEGNGCVAAATAVVEALDDIPAGFSLSVLPPDCAGEQDGAISVDSVEGGTPPYVYSLDGAPFSAQSSYTNLAPGTYSLTVQDAAGCELQQTVDIAGGQEVIVELGEDQRIPLGTSVLLYAQTNLNEAQIAEIAWSPADTAACDSCLLWEDQPQESTLYTIAVTDTNGCQATDQMRVIVAKDRKVYIPNAFSANVDGSNDLFTVFAGPDVERIRRLAIFDRWGNQVFERRNFPPNEPRLGWDGRFRGQLLDIGYFVYLVEIEFIDGEVELFEGGVHLLR
jgi:gliding motility-associated-like protein